VYHTQYTARTQNAANKNKLHYVLLIFQEGLKIGGTSPREKAGPALHTVSMARFFTNTGDGMRAPGREYLGF
jgi:hypothetical protein